MGAASRGPCRLPKFTGFRTLATTLDGQLEAQPRFPEAQPQRLPGTPQGARCQALVAVGALKPCHLVRRFTPLYHGPQRRPEPEKALSTFPVGADAQRGRLPAQVLDPGMDNPW